MRSCVNKRRRVRTNCHAVRSASIASALLCLNKSCELGDDHPDRAEAIKKELTALRERGAAIVQRWWPRCPAAGLYPPGACRGVLGNVARNRRAAVRCERCDRRWRRSAPRWRRLVERESRDKLVPQLTIDGPPEVKFR